MSEPLHAQDRESPYRDTAPLIVFDGVCVLCSRSLDFVLRHDRERRFRFALAQSPLGQALYRHYDMDPVDFRSNLVIVDGRLHTELDAFVAVMTRLPGAWPLFGALRFLPRRIADFLYFKVARNRYRWFGKTDTCLIPDDELKSRFVADGWL